MVAVDMVIEVWLIRHTNIRKCTEIPLETSTVSQVQDQRYLLLGNSFMHGITMDLATMCMSITHL